MDLAEGAATVVGGLVRRRLEAVRRLLLGAGRRSDGPSEGGGDEVRLRVAEAGPLQAGVGLDRAAVAGRARCI